MNDINFKEKYIKFKIKDLMKYDIKGGAYLAAEFEEDTLNEQQKKFVKYLQEHSPEDYVNFKQAEDKYKERRRGRYKSPPKLRELNYNLWIERYGENHTLWTPLAYRVQHIRVDFGCVIV